MVFEANDTEPEERNRHLRFELSQNSEWRVAGQDDGIKMSDYNF